MQELVEELPGKTVGQLVAEKALARDDPALDLCRCQAQAAMADEVDQQQGCKLAALLILPMALLLVPLPRHC